MTDTPPIFGCGKKLQTGHLFLGHHIPKAKFNQQAAIAMLHGAAGHQSQRIDNAPIAETRAHIDANIAFDKGLTVNRAKQARTLKIGDNNPRQILSDRAITGKIQYRNRQRLDIALRNINLQCRQRHARHQQ